MRLGDLVGQERAVAILRSAVAAGRVPHAFLFEGPGGAGKRSAALGLALSSTSKAARNLSILSLALPAASFAPVMLGALKDKWGFLAGAGCALGLAVVGITLVAAIRHSVAARSSEPA